MNPLNRPHSRLPAPSFASRRPPLATVIAAWTMLTALGSATPVGAVLQPGEDGPPFILRDSRGAARRLDDQTSGPALLVFSKPADANTSQTLNALNAMLANLPALGKGLKRWLVLSHYDGAGDIARAEEMGGPAWPVLLDSDKSVYNAYRIIATPTVVLIGAKRRIEAVNPGYDLGMEDHIRRELARVRGVKLPPAVAGSVEKPNLTLQLGRRLAQRGLWDHALIYYLEVEKKEGLSPAARCELAEIYIELNQPDDATRVLTRLQPNPFLADRIQSLLKRAEALKAPRPVETPKPPKVTR